uniref:F-box domain-containing protein n=1 Tax=Oryza punctata TaxID=4537 RepID=A0A0E0M0C2_ORYPU
MAPPWPREQEEEEMVAGGGEEAAALRAPADVIARVFSQLDCVDLLSCSLVCRQWYRDSAELREEWRKEYMEAWNQFGLYVKQQPQPPCPTCSTSIRTLRSLCS